MYHSHSVFPLSLSFPLGSACPTNEYPFPFPQKFTLDDKEEKEKPEFLKGKKGDRTDQSATQSAAE